MILMGKERLEQGGNDRCVTAMLTDIILYPPLVLEDENRTRCYGQGGRGVLLYWHLVR